MEFLIQFGFFLILFIIGLLFGRMNERRHYRSIREREQALRHIMVFNERRPEPGMGAAAPMLVSGSVVIGEDYFKHFAAWARSIFGGRLTAYETLMDRGRREAILRMKAAAQAEGRQVIFNVRLETASMNDPNRPGGNFSAEFIAYGTALTLPQAPTP